MIRFAAVALLASLLSGTAMAQSVSGTTSAVGNAVSGAASATGKAASSAASSVSKAATSATNSATALVTGEYADEASAKAHCSADTVVWVNTSSKAYHLAGTKYYGKTKKGAYMCQKDADAGGFHGPKAKPAKAPVAKTN
jgi:hypothetical protein